MSLAARRAPGGLPAGAKKKLYHYGDNPMADQLSRRAFARGAALAPLSFSTGLAWAQDYPARPIRIVTPFPPAGGADPYARLTAQWLTKTTGQNVIVENRPGGNTLIGAQAVASSSPDGYTLLLTTDQTMEISPHLYKQLPIDPLKDFIPVIKVIATGQCFLASSSLGVNTFADFVKLAKAKPGQLAYGSAGGSASPSHLNMAKLIRELGLDLIHVPFKGSSPVMTELAAGRVSVALAGLGGAAPFIQAGTIRPLAVGTDKRAARYPAVPTIGEALGRPYDYLQNWMGFFAPAGTPKAVVEKLATELKRSLSAPEIATLITNQGWEAVGTTGEEFQRSIKAGQARWGAAIKQAGVEPE
ncbi:MAG: LacI family transcriptional regulator [Ramlibacter sp.]|jgi:tripartite-type tricarboxylate transporter receptor subunit TctC|nr:LacI family transcriptional regulator [Ramlibacter sp.]